MRKKSLFLLLVAIGNFMLIAQYTGAVGSPGSTMSSLKLSIGIIGTLIGMFVIAVAYVFLAIREIALNTRGEQNTSKETYERLVIICSAG